MHLLPTLESQSYTVGMSCWENPMHQRDPSAGSIDGGLTSVLSSQDNQRSSLPCAPSRSPAVCWGSWGKHREVKGCCQAWEKPRQRLLPLEGTQAQGIRESVHFLNQVSRAGEGMGAASQHFGDWAALIPNPESEHGPQDGGGTEVNGDLSGLRVGPTCLLIYT